MAKIVFWSPEEGKSGCTHVAIAVSSLLGITHKTSSLLIDANSNAKGIGCLSYGDAEEEGGTPHVACHAFC